MTQTVKFIRMCCAVLGILILTALPPLSSAWAGPLHDAVKAGNLAKVKQLIAQGADVNGKNIFTETPLYRSAQLGHFEISRLLIEKGADVNGISHSGRTPVILAAGNGHEKVVQLLIGKGADVNAKDHSGYTSLYFAVSKGHIKLVQLLIEKGADVNTKNQYGRTPLFQAASRENVEMLQLLIATGADVNIKNDLGQTSLGLAIQRDRGEVAQLLRQHGAKVGSAEIKASVRRGDSMAKSHLHNIYLACKAMWADKGSAAHCTVQKATSIYGLLLDKEVELTITPGKDIETNLEAVSKHKQSSHSWRMNYLGSIKRAN